MGKIADIIYGKGSEFAKIAFSAIRDGKRAFGRIGRAITDTIKAKDGFAGLTNRLRKAFSQSANDAKRTARTETTRVENMARYNAGKEWEKRTGEQATKTWVCTFQNSRDSHIALHNTTIPLDEDFQAFGGPMKYPGDGSRVGPEEICNCKCYLIIGR